MMYVKEIDSPVGPLTLASDGAALTGLWIAGQKYYASTLPKEVKREDCPVFRLAEQWLADYFAGKTPRVQVALAPEGSQFRQSVWNILRSIPMGATMTYGQIAKQLEAQTGKTVSAQAVGGAVGHNPISILIPCHRVLGSDGSLTGYAAGVAVKRQLLQLEGAY